MPILTSKALMDSWQIQLDAPNAAVRFQAPDNDKFYLICYLYIYIGLTKHMPFRNTDVLRQCEELAVDSWQIC